MQKFIGTKLIKALAMNRQEYNIVRYWDLPEDEDGTDEGFLVEYLDGGKPNHDKYEGYISWSPKAQFEGAYQNINNGTMSFGHALELAKTGVRVARKGWNGSGMYIFICPAVLDLPVPIRAYMALFTAQKDISTWTPSVSDCLAEDWHVIENN